MGDGVAFVSVTVCGDDWVDDWGFGDGAGALLFEGFEEVVVFGVHINK